MNEPKVFSERFTAVSLAVKESNFNQKDLDTLRRKLYQMTHFYSPLSFRSIFGEYTDNSIFLIAFTFVKLFPSVSWNDFMTKVDFERCAFELSFLARYPALPTTSEQYTSELFQQPQHKRLLMCCRGRWTARECELLFSFDLSKNRLNYTSGIVEGKPEERLTRAHINRIVLQKMPLPKMYGAHKEVLLKAIDEVERELLDDSEDDEEDDY